jgi:nucleotide-binding universal stress UspA family protein
VLELKLILCPLDFSEFSTRAYHHAVSLAEHYGAKLVVQHVVELWRYPSAGFAASVDLYDGFCQSLCDRGMQELQEFVKANPHDGIQPEFAVHDGGSAADSILSFAQARKADVIVMGTHGRRGYDRLVLGSVTDRLMRRSPCPVLAVCCPPHESSTGGDHAAGKTRGHVHHLSRILFCADFSENSQQTLEYAIFVTTEYDAELTLLHVLEEVENPAKREEAIAIATKQLDQLIAPARRQSLKMKTAVRIGKPYQQIIHFMAEAQMDLVVMGVRGRGALDRAVFGSTTYRVIQLGPCPVLVHV